MADPTMRWHRRVWLALPILVLVAAGSFVAVRRPWAHAVDPRLPADLFLVDLPQPAFADPEHGYLLLGRCPTATCEAWVAATRDGGRSWSGAIVPGLTFPRDEGVTTPRATLYALDPTHAIIESYDSILGGPPEQRWYTSDGGRSWSEVPTTPVVTVDEIPPSAHAGTTPSIEQRQQVVVTITRLDGTSAVLASPPQPPSHPTMLSGGVVTAGDGSLWIQAGDDDDTWLFVSRDRGRNWSLLPLPAGAGVKGHGYRYEPTDGHAIYLIDDGAYRVWRTNDDGQRWAELTVPYDNGGQDLSLSATGQPDGQLVLFRPIANGAGFTIELYAVTSTGTSFGRIADTQIHNPIPQLSSHVSAQGPSWGLQHADGSWTPLPWVCRPKGCL